MWVGLRVQSIVYLAGHLTDSYYSICVYILIAFYLISESFYWRNSSISLLCVVALFLFTFSLLVGFFSLALFSFLLWIAACWTVTRKRKWRVVLHELHHVCYSALAWTAIQAVVWCAVEAIPTTPDSSSNEEILLVCWCVYYVLTCAWNVLDLLPSVSDRRYNSLFTHEERYASQSVVLSFIWFVDICLIVFFCLNEFM
jgi:hypothetical protein